MITFEQELARARDFLVEQRDQAEPRNALAAVYRDSALEAAQLALLFAAQADAMLAMLLERGVSLREVQDRVAIAVSLERGLADGRCSCRHLWSQHERDQGTGALVCRECDCLSDPDEPEAAVRERGVADVG
jgi:hypothetical protein